MDTWKNCKLGMLPCHLVDGLDESFVPISSGGGTVLLPGDTAIAEADGFPLILATPASGKIVIVAHSSRLSVVSSVIEMFERRGVQRQNVLMFFLLYSRENIAKTFAREAKDAGVLFTQIKTPLAEFLVLNKIPYWERSYAVLQVPEKEKPIPRLPKL